MTEDRITQETTIEDRKKEILRIKDIQELENQKTFSLMDTEKEEELDNQIENTKREPLSIDTEIVKKILLSWGGPSDGFKLYFSQDKELLRGVYFTADWGTYFESELTEEEADLVYNYYMGGYFE